MFDNWQWKIHESERNINICVLIVKKKVEVVKKLVNKRYELKSLRGSSYEKKMEEIDSALGKVSSWIKEMNGFFSGLIGERKDLLKDKDKELGAFPVFFLPEYDDELKLYNDQKKRSSKTVTSYFEDMKLLVKTYKDSNSKKGDKDQHSEKK